MNVVVYGATGRAGSRIVQELVSRGHKVTAVARDQSKLQLVDGFIGKEDDLADATKTAEVIRGADAVISAYAPPQGDENELVNVTEREIEAVEKAGVPRFLMVGGAGGLEVKPGVPLIESGQLPEPWIAIAKAHGGAFDALRRSSIDWTYLAPSIYFEPGERTGKFRLGKDNLLFSDKGESRISMEDYAIAMVDELEQGQHRKQRFSVGY